MTAAGIEAVAAGAHGAEEAALRGAVQDRSGPSSRATRGRLRLPAHVRRGPGPAHGQVTCSTSPGTGARTCWSTSTPSSPPRWSARSRRPERHHSFGTAVPAGDPRRDPPAAGRTLALLRPGGAAVRRLLPGGLPRHLPAGRADHARRPRPAGAADSGPCDAERRCPSRRTARLRHARHRAERPGLLREVVAGVAGLPVRRPGGRRPAADPPASLGGSRRTCRSRPWVDQAGRAGPLLGGGLARRVRHLPGSPGARAAPALPAPGRRPVPQRRGRGPGRRRAGARPRRDEPRRRSGPRGSGCWPTGGLRDAAQRVAAEIAAMPGADEVAALPRGAVP